MVNSRPDITPARRPGETLQFEQPLSERMRTFLRIELLHHQARFHSADPSDFGARAAVNSLLEIMTILSRGDIRAEALKELERHRDLLGNYRTSPGVDANRLDGLMQSVEALRDALAGVGAKYMNPLKENEFLNTIKHRSAIPGGTCMFDLPDYGFWLHLPHSERSRQLNVWLGQIEPLCDAVDKVLWLTRGATEARPCTAPGGFYQHTLDRDQSVNLVRVLIDADAGVFPEVSAGPHRFTVRFVEWQGVDARPKQASGDVSFLLALC